MDAIATDPESYSIPGNRRATAFTGFIAHYLREMEQVGASLILDIGCGKQHKPLYLSGYPDGLITGIDPDPSTHPFRFVQAVGEELPFRNGGFDAVVIATTLDHCLLPHLVLKEARRMIGYGGYLFLWETTVPPEMQGGDDFHEFRFTSVGLAEALRPLIFVDHMFYTDGMAPGCAEEFYVLRKMQ